MKRNDLVTLATTAVTTATLTVAAFWAAPLEAGGEADALTPTIPQPKLAVRGVEVTLSSAAGAQHAGDEPVLTLAAVNTAAEPVDLKLHLLMTAMSPADALSRVIRVPGRLWEADQSITLAPNEKKTLTVRTRTPLPAGNLISVTLSEAGRDQRAHPNAEALPAVQLLNRRPDSVAVLNFSIPAATGPALAAAQPRG